ncbi:hypothetical protein ABT115_22220 [Streptomyces sp. NPDC001832]|uniref:hypothetical protein n=1 Tax=Streptomyces sp. NPDC001832 TaxID=3154527 RepID=UPI0033270584
MHSHARRAVVSVLASSLALSGAIILAPTAGAVPAASCTVTPAANGTYVTIAGEGFTAPRNLNDGESTEPLNVDANGNFLLKRFQKNVDYTVLAVNEDQSNIFVNCRVVKPTGVPQSQVPGNVTPEVPGGIQPEVPGNLTPEVPGGITPEVPGTIRGSVPSEIPGSTQGTAG